CAVRRGLGRGLAETALGLGASFGSGREGAAWVASRRVTSATFPSAWESRCHCPQVLHPHKMHSVDGLSRSKIQALRGLRPCSRSWPNISLTLGCTQPNGKSRHGRLLTNLSDKAVCVWRRATRTSPRATLSCRA